MRPSTPPADVKAEALSWQNDGFSAANVDLYDTEPLPFNVPSYVYSPGVASATVGNIDKLKQLDATGVLRHEKTEDGQTPLWAACHSGIAGIASFLLRYEQLNVPDRNGYTPLMAATAMNRVECVDILLQNGADFTAKTLKYGRTAFHMAAENGHKDILEKIIERAQALDKLESLINGEDIRCGCTPLHLAVRHNRAECVDLLLKTGVNVVAGDSAGRVPLHLACLFGNDDLIERLIDADTPVDCMDKFGRTSMHLAAQYGHHSCVNILLQSNADGNIQDNLGLTPLMLAALNCHASVIACIVDRMVGISSVLQYAFSLTDIQERTVLHAAALRCSLDALRTLLPAQSCCQPNAGDRSGCTALHYAAAFGNKIACAFLIKYMNADLNACDTRGCSALSYAFQYQQPEVVRFLVEQGCSVTSGGQLVKECCLWIGRDLENRYDLLNLFLKKGADPLVRFKKNGMTVLHISALFGNIAACSSLRDREDVLTKGDVLGRIPAFYAALKAHYIALGVLTSNVQVPSDDDADADQEKKPSYLRTCKDCFGMTVVHAATLSGNFLCVELALQKGGDPNIADSFGRYPIHWAALRGQADIVMSLINRHATADVKDADGRTALHYAAKFSQATTVSALLERIKIDERDKNGSTALMMAAFAGDDDVVDMLQTAGADPMAKDSRGNSVEDYRKRELLGARVSRLLKKKNETPRRMEKESMPAELEAAKPTETDGGSTTTEVQENMAQLCHDAEEDAPRNCSTGQPGARNPKEEEDVRVTNEPISGTEAQASPKLRKWAQRKRYRYVSKSLPASYRKKSTMPVDTPTKGDDSAEEAPSGAVGSQVVEMETDKPRLPTKLSYHASGPDTQGVDMMVHSNPKAVTDRIKSDVAAPAWKTRSLPQPLRSEDCKEQNGKSDVGDVEEETSSGGGVEKQEEQQQCEPTSFMTRHLFLLSLTGQAVALGAAYFSHSS